MFCEEYRPFVDENQSFTWLDVDEVYVMMVLFYVIYMSKPEIYRTIICSLLGPAMALARFRKDFKPSADCSKSHEWKTYRYLYTCTLVLLGIAQ